MRKCIALSSTSRGLHRAHISRFYRVMNADGRAEQQLDLTVPLIPTLILTQSEYRAIFEKLELSDALLSCLSMKFHQKGLFTPPRSDRKRICQADEKATMVKQQSKFLHRTDEVYPRDEIEKEHIIHADLE